MLDPPPVPWNIYCDIVGTTIGVGVGTKAGATKRFSFVATKGAIVANEELDRGAEQLLHVDGGPWEVCGAGGSCDVAKGCGW